jgi:hypothetical protein
MLPDESRASDAGPPGPVLRENAVMMGTRAEDATRLSGSLLFAARVSWLIVALLALGLFSAAIPVRFGQLLTLTPMGNLATAQLTPQEGDLLQASGFSLTLYALYFIAVETTFAAIFAIIGLMVFMRKSDDWLAAFISMTLITFGVIIPATVRALDTPQFGLEWLVHLIQVLGWGSFFTFFYIFPDGRFVPHWTRTRPLLFAGWAIAWFLFPIANLFTWPLPLAMLVLLALFTSGAIAQIYRYTRVSNLTQRLQTKWVVFGFSGATVGILVFLASSFFLPALRQPGSSRIASMMIGIPFFAVSLLLIPISIEIAIRRYRLWEIDPLINRALVYGMLTAILAGTYSASITFSQRMFIAFTGEKSDGAIVLTTLVVASMFTPVKSRLQDFVDARLKRTATIQSLQAFGDQVKSFVEMIDVEQITQWLLEESASALGARGGAVHLHRSDALQLVCTRGAWDGNPKLSIGLEADGKPIGVVSLSARINGEEYTRQDRATLEQTAAQVARAIALARSTFEIREGVMNTGAGPKAA